MCCFANLAEQESDQFSRHNEKVDEFWAVVNVVGRVRYAKRVQATVGDCWQLCKTPTTLTRRFWRRVRQPESSRR